MHIVRMELYWLRAPPYHLVNQILGDADMGHPHLSGTARTSAQIEPRLGAGEGNCGFGLDSLASISPVSPSTPEGRSHDTTGARRPFIHWTAAKKSPSSGRFSPTPNRAST